MGVKTTPEFDPQVVMADLGVNNVGIQYSGVVLGVVSTPKSAKMKNISLEKAR